METGTFGHWCSRCSRYWTNPLCSTSGLPEHHTEAMWCDPCMGINPIPDIHYSSSMFTYTIVSKRVVLSSPGHRPDIDGAW